MARDREVSVAALGRADVIVTPASAAVRSALDRSPVVRRYTELAKGALNGALPPSVAAQHGAVCAISAQPDFVVQLTTSDAATSSRLAGVDVVIRSVPLSTTLGRIPKSSAQPVDCKTP